MAKNNSLKNFTTVVTDQQLQGRGQVDNKWISDPFKNLTFSTFISFKSLLCLHQKYLNFAVSVAIFTVLNELKIPNLKIKWPNDIMSANQKLCGILTENIIRGSYVCASIVGIGLNVNQDQFPDALSKATSIKNSIGKEIALDFILEKLIGALQSSIQLLEANSLNELEQLFLKNLYKKDIATMFKDKEGIMFMGIIRGVSASGKLQVEVEDETLQEFGLKEIYFI